MPHTLANTLCKKLHRLGEWVELFLFGGAGSREVSRARVKRRFDPFTLFQQEARSKCLFFVAYRARREGLAKTDEFLVTLPILGL